MERLILKETAGLEEFSLSQAADLERRAPGG